jgi:HAD superfamily hydrolase (TIGR01458 family)
MISGILLDLSGVLYTDNLPIQGATESLSRLQNSGLPIRYVTNTTRKPRHKIHQQLLSLGFAIDSDDLFTAPMAAHAYLTANRLSPFLLIHPDLIDEFSDLKVDKQDAVLIGDADQGFTYNNMNTAFRLLIEGAPLVAMGKNRYFMQQDGLSIDAGAFVTALEYAADTQAIITGKPDPQFYRNAINSMACETKTSIMIGDDVEADINGAIDVGMRAILVRTGKYRAGDENHISNRESLCVDSFNEAVDWILNNIR